MMHSLHVYGAGVTVHPGVVYTHVIRNNPPLSMHVVTIDPKEVSIIPSVAHGHCKATEKVTDMAHRYQAIVAINGGFFDFGQKNAFWDNVIKVLDCLSIRARYTYPVFGLKIKNEWYALSNKRAGIVGWDDDGAIIMDATDMRWCLGVGDMQFPVADINKPHAQGPIVYTPAYAQMTEEKDDVIELVIQDNKVSAILAHGGGTKIPEDGFVYAFSKEQVTDEFLENITVGMAVDIQKKYSSELYNWDNIDYLLASTPLLIKNSVITETIYKEKSSFFTKKHPRTAVGILEDGTWVFVVVEGRNNQSEGMQLLELALYMQSIGCVNALNLDGGGSSVMVIDGQPVNVPSGREWGFKGERPVSTALLVVKK